MHDTLREVKGMVTVKIQPRIVGPMPYVQLTWSNPY